MHGGRLVHTRAARRERQIQAVWNPRAHDAGGIGSQELCNEATSDSAPNYMPCARPIAVQVTAQPTILSPYQSSAKDTCSLGENTPLRTKGKR